MGGTNTLHIWCQLHLLHWRWCQLEDEECTNRKLLSTAANWQRMMKMWRAAEVMILEFIGNIAESSSENHSKVQDNHLYLQIVDLYEPLVHWTKLKFFLYTFQLTSCYYSNFFSVLVNLSSSSIYPCTTVDQGKLLFILFGFSYDVYCFDNHFSVSVDLSSSTFYLCKTLC